MKKIIPSAQGLARNASNKTQDVTVLQAFLKEFGYLSLDSEQPSALSTARDASAPQAEVEGAFDEATETALRNYQRFHSLPISGILDEATIEMMNKPRCGFPDNPTAGLSSRFIAQGNRWNRTVLTYRVTNFTPDLTAAEIRTAMRQALDLWSNVTPLRFTEVNGDADILISFESGNHGDGSSFDGPGNVLAHAFYPPPNGGAIAGDAHFDEAETWTVNIPVPSGGIDLLTVAAHEFGHSLGLDHSAVQGALMFPTYSGSHRFLAQDDIDGIRSIYGSEGVDKVGTIGESGWPGVWSNLGGALIHPRNGKAYFFKGNQYQRFDFTSPEKVDKVGTIGESGWPDVWSNLDGALVHPRNGKAYFFKGNQYQRFDFTSPEKVDKVGTIGESGWPGVWSNLDGALVHPRNGKAYFFKGNQYQRFDFTSPEKVDKVGTIGESGWPGVWSNLDGALVHPRNGKAYFFKGNQYQRFEFASS